MSTSKSAPASVTTSRAAPTKGRSAAAALLAAAVLAVVGTVLSSPAGAAGPARTPGANRAATVALTGSAPAWVAHARDLGPVPGNRPVDFEVVLAVPREAALVAEAEAVSTPGDAAFRHFLTTAQFAARFSPSTGAVHAVDAWVRSAGLHVASVARSRLYVEVRGTMAEAERLVGTRLDRFAYRGLTLAEPVGAYRLPAALAHTVAGILDLDDSSALVHPDLTLPGPPPGARYGVQPCSSYYGQKMATDKPIAYGKHWPYTICGYDAVQYEKAFGLYRSIQRGIDGKGVTVAVVDAYSAPTILSDADTWSTQNDIPPFAAGQFTEDVPAPNGYSQPGCGPQGWYGEETLDVEAVHAMAPGANVLFVGGANCNGALNRAWASVIDDHLASVETDSWSYNGEDVPTSLQDFYNQFLLEAATTGITVQFSSGDSGDNATVGGKSVDFPASNPWATGVGATSTEIGANGSIVFQAGWSNSYSQLAKGQWTPAPPGTWSSGSGGGTSVLYPQPFYQKGVVPASMSEYFGKTPMRTVPDVAMPGDPNTGLRVGETQQFPNGTYYATYRIGGTSLSSPLFAGVVADADQYNGAPVGFINPLLYRDIDTSAITDVLPPTAPTATVRTNFANDLNPAKGLTFELQTIDVQTTIVTAPGYDDQTGVGTPNGLYFLEAMRYGG